MKKYKAIIIDDENEGVYGVSIVDVPATMVAMITMNNDGAIVVKAKRELLFSDDDKKEVIAPLLIPGQNIYRNDNGEEYSIYFDRDTIREAATRFINKKEKLFDVQHDGKPVEGIVLMDSMVTDEYLRFKSDELTDGTWFVRLKVNNEGLWNEIKNGKYNGLSISGLFTLVEDKTVIEEEEDDEETFLNSIYG